jgi:hypothetical protein
VRYCANFRVAVPALSNVRFGSLTDIRNGVPAYRYPNPDSIVLIVRTRIKRSSHGEKYLM